MSRQARQWIFLANEIFGYLVDLLPCGWNVFARERALAEIIFTIRKGMAITINRYTVSLTVPGAYGCFQICLLYTSPSPRD